MPTPPLPVRNGVGPTRLRIPANTPGTILDHLRTRFPHLSDDALTQRVTSGEIVGNTAPSSPPPPRRLTTSSSGITVRYPTKHASRLISPSWPPMNTSWWPINHTFTHHPGRSIPSRNRAGALAQPTEYPRSGPAASPRPGHRRPATVLTQSENPRRLSTTL